MNDVENTFCKIMQGESLEKFGVVGWFSKWAWLQMIDKLVVLIIR